MSQVESNGTTKIDPHLHLEVRVSRQVAKSAAEARITEVETFLKAQKDVRNWKSLLLRCAKEKSDVEASESAENAVEEIIEKVLLGTTRHDDGLELAQLLPAFTASTSNVHFYKLNDDGPLSQSLSDVSNEESVVGSQLWQLPCVEFEHIWENLIYDSNLKNELMSYVYALIRFSDLGANPKIINVNRLILLLGPPGTGKTSLCKGLVQHLSIRLNSRYMHSVLVEVNSHSLFSKWFSESGKLIQRMFDQIDELADDKKCMVFVLIDEVESLGMSRESSTSRSEPTDAIRAVNALLTQIDRIRRRPNVLIMCTSNLERCLDRALVDRADFVRHVGLPSKFALYAMLRGCLVEMQRIGLVEQCDLDTTQLVTSNGKSDDELLESTKKLLGVAEAAQNRQLSGRAVSLLPTVVYSRSTEDSMDLETCIRLFENVVAEKPIPRSSDCD